MPVNLRGSADNIIHFGKDVSVVLLLGLASSVVFVLLFIAVGPSWQAALGAGIFIGFVSMLAVLCLPFTGVASTVCSAAALTIYALAGSIAGFNAPFWVALAAAVGGFALLPAIAAVAVSLESRRK